MRSSAPSGIAHQVARSLAVATAGGKPVAPLGVVARDRRRAGEMAEEIRRQARAQGATVFTGSWHHSLRRPYGGIAELADRLAEGAWSHDPDLLDRFKVTLVNLLPVWRRHDSFRETRELHSRLADFALHADHRGLREFYWRRDVSPWLAADLGRLFALAVTATVEATGGPVLLLLEGVPTADETAHRALGIIGRYTSRAPAVLCAVFAGPPREAKPGDLWNLISAEGEGAEIQPSPSPAATRLLAAASVLALPTSAERWRSLAEEAFSTSVDGGLEELLQEDWVEAPREDALTVATGFRRNALLAGLESSLRRRLHRLALKYEQADPFVALWHAAHADEVPEGVDLVAVRCHAVERAWGVSDYRCAFRLARQPMLRQGEPARERDLVLALLAYERGRHRETERRLKGGRLQRANGQTLDVPTRQLLLGYNAVFGLGEFDRGRRILAEACRLYEESGRVESANGVRNSMAFALARSGRLDDALSLEETAFASLHRHCADDAFLAIILQLNLARLQRNAGQPEVAVDLLRRATDDSRQELNPYLLLILHTALAEIHAASGDDPAALTVTLHGYELARDLTLDHVSDPVITALARTLGRRLDIRLPRGEEVLVYFELVLAASCDRLGLAQQAEAWRRSARARWPGATAEPAPDDEPAGTTPPRMVAPGPVTTRSEKAALEAVRSPLLVEEDSRATPASAAERLAAGCLVAVVRQRDFGGAATSSQSLLLFDPRRTDLAALARDEVGAERWAGVPAAIATEAAADLFQPRLDPSLPGYQEATLRRSERQRLAAVTPICLRVQIVSPLFESFLAELITSFAERSGISLLAALPFHLRDRDLADSPQRAVAAFLVSSVDHLLLDNRMLAKRFGKAAIENLLHIRPRLSQQADILPQLGELVVRVRIWSYRSHLRLKESMRPFLSDCDGRRTLGELLPEWKRRLNGHPQADRQIHAFLRELWHRGVIRFDLPTGDGSPPPFASWSTPRPQFAATGR